MINPIGGSGEHPGWSGAGSGPDTGTGAALTRWAPPWRSGQRGVEAAFQPEGSELASERLRSSTNRDRCVAAGPDHPDQPGRR
jgi:hypothetical protein